MGIKVFAVYVNCETSKWEAAYFLHGEEPGKAVKEMQLPEAMSFKKAEQYIKGAAK